MTLCTQWSRSCIAIDKMRAFRKNSISDVNETWNTFSTYLNSEPDSNQCIWQDGSVVSNTDFVIGDWGLNLQDSAESFGMVFHVICLHQIWEPYRLGHCPGQQGLCQMLRNQGRECLWAIGTRNPWTRSENIDFIEC